MTKLTTIFVRFDYPTGELDPYSPVLTDRLVDTWREKRIEALLDMFARAGEAGADLVVGPEDTTGMYPYATNFDTFVLFKARAETIPGPTTNRVSALARKYGMYSGICLFENEGTAIYNTAVLIDRSGQVIGKYRKVHLPPQERWLITPGNDHPVFETDFGILGFSICYDIMFPESMRTTAMNGANIIIHMGWTTYTYPEETLKVRALENMVWLVACNNTPDGISAILDPSGTFVARATKFTEGLAIVEANLRIERDLPPDNLYAGNRTLRSRMTQERRPYSYSPLIAEKPPLAERYVNDPIPKTEEEFRRLHQAVKARRSREAILRLKLEGKL